VGRPAVQNRNTGAAEEILPPSLEQKNIQILMYKTTNSSTMYELLVQATFGVKDFGRREFVCVPI